MPEVKTKKHRKTLLTRYDLVKISTGAIVQYYHNETQTIGTEDEDEKSAFVYVFEENPKLLSYCCDKAASDAPAAMARLVGLEIKAEEQEVVAVYEELVPE